MPMDQQLIKQIQEFNRQYMQSLPYLSDCYCHINFNENSISDIENLCVSGSSILRFDTSFEIIDSFWLTDTCYTNLSVTDESGNHPNQASTRSKKCTFLDNLRTITQEGNMETRPMTPFFIYFFHSNCF